MTENSNNNRRQQNVQDADARNLSQKVQGALDMVKGKEAIELDRKRYIEFPKR